jgi:hypothetical protein
MLLGLTKATSGTMRVLGREMPAQRADALARDLGDRDVAFERRSGVSFSFEQDDPVLFRRINAMLGGETPIVFVNGRIKANPALDDVIAEYRAAQR